MCYNEGAKGKSKQKKQIPRCKFDQNAQEERVWRTRESKPTEAWKLHLRSSSMQPKKPTIHSLIKPARWPGGSRRIFDSGIFWARKNWPSQNGRHASLCQRITSGLNRSCLSEKRSRKPEDAYMKKYQIRLWICSELSPSVEDRNAHTACADRNPILPMQADQ